MTNLVTQSISTNALNRSYDLYSNYLIDTALMKRFELDDIFNAKHDLPLTQLGYIHDVREIIDTIEYFVHRSVEVRKNGRMTGVLKASSKKSFCVDKETNKSKVINIYFIATNGDLTILIDEGVKMSKGFTINPLEVVTVITRDINIENGLSRLKHSKLDSWKTLLFS